MNTKGDARLVRLGAMLRAVVASPQPCPGCGTDTEGPGCPGCRRALSRPVRPLLPGAPGSPVCVAAGEYADARRRFLLAFKEHARRDLARPLAGPLRSMLAAGSRGPPVVLVPIPATRAALRERGFDHVRLLSQRIAAGAANARVMPALRAAARDDSVGLRAEQRLAAARASLRVAPWRAGRIRSVVAAGAGRVVLVDDIVTSGATLSAAREVLATAGIRADLALVVAATRRRFGSNPCGNGW